MPELDVDTIAPPGVTDTLAPFHGTATGPAIRCRPGTLQTYSAARVVFPVFFALRKLRPAMNRPFGAKAAPSMLVLATGSATVAPTRCVWVPYRANRP